MIALDASVTSIVVLMFCMSVASVCIFFFFQAEDGIRDRDVTGVQTCALPISGWRVFGTGTRPRACWHEILCRKSQGIGGCDWAGSKNMRREFGFDALEVSMATRSEERRVGKECRAWWLWAD